MIQEIRVTLTGEADSEYSVEYIKSAILSTLNGFNQNKFKLKVSKIEEETEIYATSRQELIKNLGRFICMDDSDAILEAYDGLTSDNDNDMADDHFNMWQPLENRLTVKQLIEQI